MEVGNVPVSTINEGPRKSNVKEMRLARIETQRRVPMWLHATQTNSNARHARDSGWSRKLNGRADCAATTGARDSSCESQVKNRECRPTLHM